MAKRDWINPPEPPIQTLEIDTTKIYLPTPLERMNEALLSLADLAYSLESGQYMVIQRHDGKDHPDGRLFTARVYEKVKETL